LTRKLSNRDPHTSHPSLLNTIDHRSSSEFGGGDSGV